LRFLKFLFNSDCINGDDIVANLSSLNDPSRFQTEEKSPEHRHADNRRSDTEKDGDGNEDEKKASK
jgi:hypothetical protein